MLEQLDIPRISQEVPEAVRRVLTGKMPSPAEFIEQNLVAMTVAQAVILLVAGVIFVIYGWQAFRLLVIANGAFVGGVAGAHVACRYVGQDMALFGLLAGGLLLAVLVIPLIRYMVTLAGGLAGAYAGYHAWPNLIEAVDRPEWVSHGWAGALVGLIVLGLLCFLTFRLIVMIVTAVEGAMMAISGALALCLRYEPIAEWLRTTLIDHRFLLPLLFTVPSVVGFALQFGASRSSSSSSKSSSPSGEKAGAAA